MIKYSEQPLRISKVLKCFYLGESLSNIEGPLICKHSLRLHRVLGRREENKWAGQPNFDTGRVLGIPLWNPSIGPVRKLRPREIVAWHRGVNDRAEVF